MARPLADREWTAGLRHSLGGGAVREGALRRGGGAGRTATMPPRRASPSVSAWTLSPSARWTTTLLLRWRRRGPRSGALDGWRRHPRRRATATGRWRARSGAGRRGRARSVRPPRVTSAAGAPSLAGDRLRDSDVVRVDAPRAGRCRRPGAGGASCPARSWS